MTTAIRAPRVYDEMREAEYHAHTALSASGAHKLLSTSPARFAYEREYPPSPRPEFDLGHAAHRLVLGVGAELVRIDAQEWRSNAVKAEVAAVRAEGKIPLKPNDYATVHGMADAIRRDPIAAELFDRERMRPELSLFWHDADTFASRRARLDALSTPDTDGAPVIADYKTTTAADLDHISKALWNYGYCIQAPWYRDAAIACGLAPRDVRFIFLFQEKDPPYVITPVEPDQTVLAVGERRARRAIEIYRDCTEAGVWPGHVPAGEIPLVGLPAYIERQYAQPDGEWM